MPIPVTCPHCDWKGRVRDGLAGGKGRCPTCGEVVPVPQAAATPPKPAPKRAADEQSTPKAKRSLGDALSSARGRAVDDDDRPAKSRRRPVDEDDDRPAKSRRRPADDDDADDDRPRRKAARADDADDEPRPRKKKKKRRAGDYGEGEGGGINSRSVSIAVAVIFLIIGLGLIAFNLLVLGRIRPYGFIPLLVSIISLVQAFRQEE